MENRLPVQSVVLLVLGSTLVVYELQELHPNPSSERRILFTLLQAPIEWDS